MIQTVDFILSMLGRNWRLLIWVVVQSVLYFKQLTLAFTWRIACQRVRMEQFRTVVSKLWTMGQILPTSFFNINRYWNTAAFTYFHIIYGVGFFFFFALLQQSLVNATEIICPAKPKILIIWTLTETVCTLNYRNLPTAESACTTLLPRIPQWLSAL